MTTKFKKFISGLIIFLSFVFPLFAHAQEGIGKKVKDAMKTTGCRAGFFPCDGTEPDFVVILGLYIGGILGLMGIVFMIWIIIGGWNWMTASGNEEKITKAKKTIIGASIGLAIILLAATIVRFVLSTLAPGASGTLP